MKKKGPELTRLKLLLEDNATLELPLIPLRQSVIFPGERTELLIGRESSVAALQNAVRNNGLVFAVCQKDSAADEPGADDLHPVGTVCRVVSATADTPGPARVRLLGVRRGRMLALTEGNARIRLLPPPAAIPEAEQHEWLHTTLETLKKHTRLKSRGIQLAMDKAVRDNSPRQLASILFRNAGLDADQLQRVLECRSVEEQVALVLYLANSANRNESLKADVAERVRMRLESIQKEFYLNEQLHDVRRDLGKEGDEHSLLDDLRTRAEEAALPSAVLERFRREISRLSTIPQFSPEAGILSGYLEWLLELPWHTLRSEERDIHEIEKDLNASHFGLDEVKRSILEFVAVNILAGDAGRGSILCLTGPPGTGKTTLAMSIARALKRDFVRMSLGGLRDEAEIRGHRRTYIGAMPGRIIQNIRKAGSRNPVFLLDEIDKMGSDHRGDPASALLEVLDPEINDTFQDNFLELEYDLSRVLFITTANSLHTVPEPLRDRMEVVNISGYTREEKLEIGCRFLLPKQKKLAGIKTGALAIPRPLVARIIDLYTREAGVRKLEQMLRRICRKTAYALLAEPDRPVAPLDRDALEEMLGQPRHKQKELDGKMEKGLAYGLAWTETGGQVLAIETRCLPGSGKISLTGKLGEVMQESARIALSWVRHLCLTLKPDFSFTAHDFHIHVPEGAIPKDGPSAGITIACAALSAIIGRPLRSNFAMTGEISLLGSILPVGGLKEKILAARQSGLKKIILPEQNRRDISELKPKIRQGLDLLFVSKMEEVLRAVLPQATT